MRSKTHTNSFSGAARPTKISDTRKAIEEYLLANAGQHNAKQIAQATGKDLSEVRKKLANMASDNTVVNTTPGQINCSYQHIEHWQRSQVVNRADPITNSRMPNGSTAWWGAFMARFNAPPRVA